MNKRKVRITNTGYLPNSPDRHNPMNIIPSNQITMDTVPFPILGIDNLGNQQMMLPGVDYTFPGQYVTEIPLGKYQKGKQVPRYIDDKDEFLKAFAAYQDSTILNDAYNFQKSTSEPYYREWLNDAGSSYPGGPSQLKADRERNMKVKYGQIDRSAPITKKGFKNNNDSQYDPLTPSEKPLVNKYTELVRSSANPRNFRIGMHTSPDLWHRNIMPIATYYDGSYSPVYAAPKTMPVWTGDPNFDPNIGLGIVDEETLNRIEPLPLKRLPVTVPSLKNIDTNIGLGKTFRKSQNIGQLNYGNRTGQQPNYEAVWDSVNKKWVMRAVESEEKDYYNKKNKIQKQHGGLTKYQGDQGASQVVSAGTDEMWVPLDNMTPEESKQWASLRGDALPYIGKQASNQGIYKAYDFAKSQGMDYNQYLNWLKTSSEQKEKSKPRKSLQLPIESDIIQGSDATSNIRYKEIPYEMAEYFSKLPNSPIGQDPYTGDFIYLGTPSKYERFDGKYEYYYPTYLLDYNSPEELKKDVKSQIMDRAKRDVDNEQVPEVKQSYIERLNRLENMSPDQMTQYLFDYEFDPNDESQYKNINKPEEPYIKLVLNDTLGEYQDWTTDSNYLNPLVIPAYNTNAEAEGAKAKYDYIKESMNSPLAKFLGAEPGKVNPNVAKRAEIHGYDVAAEFALNNMSSILGLNRSRGNYDTEGIRHILQNPDAFNKQLSSIINSPFGYGTVSMDITGSNRLDNVSISKEEAEKLSKYINIIKKSPKFSYMSEATPQDKFIQGTGLGWFMPTSEAAKNANLLDAAVAPFELAGNVLGNYINDIIEPGSGKLGNLFGNEFPTAAPQPLAYSLTDPAGAAFISSLYKGALDVAGSELGLKMLSGVNNIGRSIANTAKDVVSYPRPSIDMGRFRPGFITDEYAANELNKLGDLRYDAFSKETRPFTKLFTTNKQLKKSPLNPKVKIISEIDRNGVPKIGNVEELERVVLHPNSGLTPSEMMLFNEVKSGEELTNQQIAAFYKAQLNQYGATRVAPETLSWQQRLKNSIPFTKKTDTFYKSSKIKKGRTETQEELIDAFNINNPNRAFTKEEYDIQKRLFDISGKTKQNYSRGALDWRLGDDIRNNMARGTRSYAGAAGLVGTGAMSSIIGALIDRNTDIKYDYIDPYLNPILNKLGINTASDSKAPSENLSIDLSEPGSELSSVRVNQQDLPKDFNIIIGGEFIYENPNTVQTADFYTKNPDFKVGDKAFRAAESNAFYGIEDGKLKAGKPEEFKPETIIVPTIPANKNDFTPIKQAGLSENGEVRLIDANDQPIYQTAGSSGKLLLYSPNTGKSYFVYNSGNDLKDVVLKINNIIAKDPDVRSVTIDNGRYDHYIENKEGLTKSDFEKYYEADLQNPGSPGFNLVLKYPKKQQYGGLIKAQKGLKVPTATDSLDVLNSSLAAERFYQGQKYNVTSTSPYFKSPNDFKNELDAGYKSYINKLNNDRIVDLNGNILVSSQHSPYAPNDYYRDVQKSGSFRIRQKEQASGTLNPKAPKITYDTRIVPQAFKVYTGFPDSAGIFTYDKLATTPWSKLSPKQKKQRLKQFGVSGTPYKNVNEGLKKLNSTPTESTTNRNDDSELTYIKPKDISRIPVSEPKLIPIPHSNFETNTYQKKEPIYRMNYGQHKGQVQIGENVWDNTTKRWKRRMFEPEEIDYLLKKGAIETSEQKPLKKSSQGVMSFKDGGIYLGKYMFKDGGLVKYQYKGEVDNTNVYINTRMYDDLYDNQELYKKIKNWNEQEAQENSPYKNEYPVTYSLAAGLNNVPRYKDTKPDDFFKLLDLIAAVESTNQNIPQVGGGPGRGYYQVEPPTAITARNRAAQLQKDLKGYGYDLQLPEKFDTNFMNLSKDEQAFYTLSNIIKAASAKRQNDPNYNIDFTNPGKAWIDLHWAGKDSVRPKRVEHWNEINKDNKIALDENGNVILVKKQGGLVKAQKGKEYKTPTGQSIYLDPRFKNQRYYVDEKGNAVTPDQNMSLFDVQDNIWESGTSMVPLEVSPRYTYKKVPGALGAMETIRVDADNGTEQTVSPDVMATNREMQSFVNSFNPAGLLTEGVGNIAQGNIGEGLIQTGLSIPIVGQTIGKAVTAPLKFAGREVASTYGPALSETGRYLTRQTPLRNTWKLLPEGTFKNYSKLNNPNKSYRVAGFDNAEDFVQSGVLRSKTPKMPEGLSFAQKMLFGRPTGFPSFQKGYADLRYLPEEGGVVFETSLPTFKRGEINPVTGLRIKGRHYAHRVIDPETGKTMVEIPSENIKMFESNPNWLKGYKQINPDEYQEGGSKGKEYKTPTSGLVKAQKGLNKRMVRQYPGMKTVYGDRGENLNVIKDKNFIPAEYGYGNIEFIYPGSGLVVYNDDYAYQSPTPDKYTAVYNPKGANKHDVFLDMMHGMRHDPEYMELLNEFETATRNARGADMDYFYNQDAQRDPNFVIDGREQWDKNYIDGMVRAHMYKLASQEKHLPFVNPFGSKPHGTEDYEMELGPSSPEMYQAADQIYNYIKGDKRKNNSSLKKVKIKSLPRKNQ